MARSSKEEDREYMRKYREQNREKINENNKKYRKRHRLRLNADSRKTHRERRDKDKSSALKRHYGITLSDYAKILADQNGRCAICGRDQAHGVSPFGVKRTYLDVDHCHATGEVRGILCSRCNKIVGMFNDNPELFEKTAQYLRSFEDGRRPFNRPLDLLDIIESKQTNGDKYAT